MDDEPAEEEAGSGLILDDEPHEVSAPAEVPEPTTELIPEPESEHAEETPLAPAEEQVEKVEIEPVESADESAATADEPAAKEMAGGIPETIDFPVGALVHGHPEFFTESTTEGFVALNIPDLAPQLLRGIVTMSLTAIADALPEGALKDGVTLDAGTTISLDLKETVKAIGLDALIASTGSSVRDYDLDWMADPFEEPDEKPDLEAVRIAKKQKKKAAADAPVPEPDPQMSPKITVYKPAADGDSELEYYELPGNININAASADELMVLKGVGRHLADAVVSFREEHGGFKSVFDLFKVDGIDEVRFRRMTGMKSEQKRRHRRKRMASLLKIPAARVADLCAIAEAVSRKAGFSGCIISDRDGLVLAQHGLDGLAENLSAVLPSMLGQIGHGLGLAGLSVTGTITISVEGQLYTVKGTDNVILLAAHAENMVGESDLSYIRKISRELAWLLSVRAYAGPIP